MRTAISRISAVAFVLIPVAALAQPSSSAPARTWNFEGTLWESLDLAHGNSSGASVIPSEDVTLVPGESKRSGSSSGAANVADDAAANSMSGSAAGGIGAPVLGATGAKAHDPGGPTAAAGTAKPAVWSPPPAGGSAGVAPVPEPETYVLMLAGLGVLGIVISRRRKRQVVPD